MANNKIELIRQALSAAESSIKLAKQLLAETEKGGPAKGEASNKLNPMKKERPGITGTFDGEQMITDSGEKHPVPENYASKSLLVVGDTLKLVEDGGEKRFKQIEHVKRHKTVGILAKKDGKWKAVTPEGSYKVLPAAVAHFSGEVGDEVVLHLPAGNLSVSYGAIESVKNKVKPETVGEQKAVVEEPKVENKKNTQKPIKQPKEKEKETGPKIEKEIKIDIPSEVKPVKEIKEAAPVVAAEPAEDELT